MNRKKIQVAREKARNVISAIRASRQDLSRRRAELEEQRKVLAAELEELQAQSEHIRDKKIEAQADLVQAETADAVEQLSEEIAGLDVQMSAISDALGEKQAEIDQLIIEESQIIVDCYPAEVERLKKERDDDYQEIIDVLAELEDLYAKLMKHEAGLRGVTAERNQFATKAGVEPIATSGWNISVEVNGTKVAYALPASFAKFLARLSELLSNGAVLKI